MILLTLIPQLLISQFAKKKETKRWLAPCLELSVNNPFVYGINWKMHKNFGITLLSKLENTNYYQLVVKDKGNGNTRIDPYKLGFNIFRSGNVFCSLSLDYNYDEDETNVHSLEMSYKEIKYDITYHENYYSGLLNTVQYINKNKIYQINYKYNRVLHPNIIAIARIGFLLNDYINEFDVKYKPDYETSSKMIIKPQMDIGLIFKLNVLNY